MEFNRQQGMAVNAAAGNICVIAAAGSGKTTVLTHRIKNIIENHGCRPSSVLAVTFSRKAKDTIVEKLGKLGIKNASIETFHSLALKIITSGYGPHKFKVWTAAWEKEKFIKDICCSLGLCHPDDVPFNEISGFIALQKNNMRKPGGTLIYTDSLPFIQKDMAAIYAQYEKEKEKNGYIEFDDFLNMANDVFDTMPDILGHYQQKFKYILADEFQDVSMSQALLLQKINGYNTMVVGDPLQAIYAFRGGNSKYIMDFNRTYKNASVINLSVNYRCSAGIVKTANRLAESIPDSKHENYVESIAYNGNYKLPGLAHFTDEHDESMWISGKIMDLKKEYSYDSIAVLARTNAQLQKFETCFHKAGIPFDVVGGTLFTDLPEIKLVLSYLRLAYDTGDNEAFRYLYNKPNRWLDRKFLAETTENAAGRKVSLYESMSTIRRRCWRFRDGIDEILEVIKNLQDGEFGTVSGMVTYIRQRLGIDRFVSKGKQADDGGYAEQADNLDSFGDMCKEYTSVGGLLSYLDKMNKEAAEKKKENIKLLTIHKAKGMEFPVVFIAGCSDGLLPHSRSCDTDDERRLFYVAITRAVKEIYITCPHEYNNIPMAASPFIEDIKGTVNVIGASEIMEANKNSLENQYEPAV